MCGCALANHQSAAVLYRHDPCSPFVAWCNVANNTTCTARACVQALEVRNAELVNANSSLQGTVHAQSGTITALQQHAAQQAAQLDATRAALVNSQAQVGNGGGYPRLLHT